MSLFKTEDAEKLLDEAEFWRRLRYDVVPTSGDEADAAAAKFAEHVLQEVVAEKVRFFVDLAQRVAAAVVVGDVLTGGEG